MQVDINGHTVTIADDRVRGSFQEQLQRYLAGEAVTFDHEIDLDDLSPFTSDILERVRAIPYGETRTYGDIAAAMGSPGAARAVAQACNQNPVPIVVPCHRVVAEDGLGGYRHGEDVKRALLELEGVDVPATDDT
ncbi:MAG: methylated-DNA--[protein]-cysteine S-methyltransferase [Candidatus Nanohaloarchaea archaeon]|nr:methylated-DNA--[protein]-cysteine S-methyltransferase [Candidatus Nanohaloarchaea archaeon]